MTLYNTAMQHRLLLFDLDETIYPPSNGLWMAISVRMAEYMTRQLGIAPEDVHNVRRHYFETYGTTLRGLQIHRQIDTEEFLEYVHNIPLEDVLLPDPELRPLLLSLPQPKWICTNADDNHARRVLHHLGVLDCFEGIVDIQKTGFSPKPSSAYFKQALKIIGGSKPEYCVFFDDLPRNLAPARAMGIITVLVNPNNHNDPDAYRTVPNLHHLPEIFPELWRK